MGMAKKTGEKKKKGGGGLPNQKSKTDAGTGNCDEKDGTYQNLMSDAKYIFQCRR